MADTHDNGPGYGQLGETSYLPENQKWLPHRSLEAPCRIEAVGPAQIVIPSPHHQSTDGSDNASVAIQHRWQAALEPQVVLSADLATQHDPVAREVLATKITHDPLIGNLIAFGLVRDARAEKSRQVAIYVSDPGRRQLSVTRVLTQRQGWTGNLATSIQVPQLGGEQGRWESPSPIEQIEIVNDASAKLGYVAARTSHGTYLLRVRLGDYTVSHYQSSPSRFKISVKHFTPSTGDGPSLHSDVSLNTLAPGQYALSDVSGHWKAIDCTTSFITNHSLSDFIPVQQPDEILGDPRDYDDTGPRRTFVHDGWTRITWLNDRRSLLVCNRTSLILVDAETDFAHPVALDRSERSGHWFLDMRPCPKHPDRIILLTTTCVYLAQLHTRFKADSPKTASTDLKLLAKVRHFRDHADTSLKLSVSAQHQGTFAILSSGSTSLASCIVFRDQHSSSGITVTVSAPQELPLLFSKSLAPVANVYLQSAPWLGPSDDTRSDSTAVMYREAHLHFMTAFILHTDFSISQQLLVIVPLHGTQQDGIAHPEWRAKIRYTPDQAGSAFVVHDGDIEESDDEALEQAVARLHLERKPRAPYKRSLDLQQLYECLVGQEDDSPEDLVSLLAKVRDDGHADTDATVQKLLLDYAEAGLAVGDLDESHEAFEALLQQSSSSTLPGESDERTIAPIAHPSHLRLDLQDNSINLRAIYTAIVTSYLASLPPSVPGRIRLAREQLARRTAATLLLSTHSLRPTAPPPTPPEPLTAALTRLSPLSATPLPSLPPLSTTPAAILSHWTASPTDYDFAQARAGTLSQRETANLSAADRAKADRRAARLAARRAREARRLAWESSQALPPEVGGTLRSSPPPLAVAEMPRHSEVFQGLQSSQLFSSQGVPAGQSSQVFPGRGTPARKKVRTGRRRTEGF